MRVENATRGTVVAGAADLARGTLARGLGLMGRRDWRTSDGLVLPSCNSVHSCFMRLPIDVLYLDREGRVLRLLAPMRPWRIGPIVLRATTVVELPVGAIEASGTRPGDLIALLG